MVINEVIDWFVRIIISPSLIYDHVIKMITCDSMYERY